MGEACPIQPHANEPVPLDLGYGECLPLRVGVGSRVVMGTEAQLAILRVAQEGVECRNVRSLRQQNDDRQWILRAALSISGTASHEAEVQKGLSEWIK